MFKAVVVMTILVAAGVKARIPYKPEPREEYEIDISGDMGSGNLDNFDVGSGLPSISTLNVRGTMRTIVLSEVVANITRLLQRVQTFPMASSITELLTRLGQISPANVAMLANPNRQQDNELVDNVLVANNIINQMLSSSDEQLRRDPVNLAALVYASNNIAEYNRTHRIEREPEEDEGAAEIEPEDDGN
ncbi:unnamed protein product [Cylicocyclus nassatus]|uniref:Uncharacterized protein n=1 Tax=Cylicocyclus nassatus TaxID=53992 RepID=A0AA36DLX2_CYLNA|nr:unnamed protein product [Cylicocyclus nassatus]